jgi:hypothetical protein
MTAAPPGAWHMGSRHGIKLGRVQESSLTLLNPLFLSSLRSLFLLNFPASHSNGYTNAFQD